MALLAAMFEVRDVDAYRALFERNEELRQQHGATNARVFTRSGEPNMVLLLCEFPTGQDAEAYLYAATSAGGPEEATLEGIPRIEVFEDAW